MEIAGETFEGPYTDTAKLKDSAGVYVVYTETSKNQWRRLDVGQSEAVKTRIENHDRADCWNENKKGDLGYCVKYLPNENERLNLESRARAERNIPCGDH